jgi:hypothetical protein
LESGIAVHPKTQSERRSVLCILPEGRGSKNINLDAPRSNYHNARSVQSQKIDLARSIFVVN